MDRNLKSCFQRQYNRSESEYDFLGKLGKGGFGSVSKVRNKLDKRIYALKRIQVNIQSRNFVSNIAYKRREVVYLAELNHCNVVRYFTAWIDLPQSDILESDTDTSEEADKGFYSTSSLRSDLKDDNVKEKPMKDASDSIVFAEPNDDHDDKDNFISSKFTFNNVKEKLMAETDSDSFAEPNDDDDNDNDDLIRSDFISIDVKEKLMTEIEFTNWKSGLESGIFDLCITMECCDKTLRDCIDSGIQSNDIRWRFFKDILTGLDYIHGKDLIHRDLKPENIFICGKDYLCVKIGDFGLATMANPETRERPPLSGDIGSLLYAAPEVKSKECSTYNYDQRSDVFSLGLVFFEMCYRPLKTCKEKVKIFDALRGRTLPDDFQDKRSEEIILEMLQKEMQFRPFARDILKSVSSILSCIVDCDQEGDEQVMSDLQPSQSAVKDHQFARLKSLVTRIGSKVMRRLFLFHTVTPEGTLGQYLNKYKNSISQMRYNMFLTQVQIDSLFSEEKPPCLKEFDIEAMSALLLHIVPTLNDEERKQIKELKKLMSQLAHSPSHEMSSNYFNESWEKAESILTKLSKRFQDTDFEEEIQKKH